MNNMLNLIKQEAKQIPQTLYYRYKCGESNFSEDEWLKIISISEIDEDTFLDFPEKLQILTIKNQPDLVTCLEPCEKYKQIYLNAVFIKPELIWYLDAMGELEIYRNEFILQSIKGFVKSNNDTWPSKDLEKLMNIINKFEEDNV